MTGALATALRSLDQLKMALKIVAALSDGAVNVPGLRAAACTAIEIIEIAQSITKNKEDAIEVAKSAAERTSSLLDALKGKSTDDIPSELQKDIAQYAEKLERVQKILAKHKAQTGMWRRVVARTANRDDINKCKDILNDSFQVFQVSLTLKQHMRLPEPLDQLRSFVIAQANPVPPRLSIIRREELDLREYWRLDGNTSVVLAEYKSKRVVVRKYGNNKKQWAADLDAWLESDAWHPHYLQIIGQSDDSACSLHLVFQDPGVPVQTYIEHRCRDSVEKCTVEVLTMVIQFAVGLLNLRINQNTELDCFSRSYLPERSQ
ncbi:hypothetical protein B0H19DRAFT_316848 [Mycena capillaripes]|nr:hypothetical protein B0H19DRAFT_316848 [Mycena capillaripes]